MVAACLTSRQFEVIQLKDFKIKFSALRARGHS